MAWIARVDQDDNTGLVPLWWVLIALLVLLVLLSPIGAPAIGILLGSICPVDPTVYADGPFALDMHYCGVSRPIEHLYQSAMFLPVVAVVLAGPVLGGIVGLAWYLAALLSLLAMPGLLLRWLLERAAERV